MSKSETKDPFKEQLEAARAEVEAEAFPMEFEGFPCRVRVMPRLLFIRAGRMPEHLTRQMIARIDGTGEPREETAEEIVAGEVFMRKAVCAVLVSPRVVESEPVPEGGYLYATLEENAPKFVRAVYAWVMRDCPKPGNGGEGKTLGVDDLETFPESCGRGAGAQSGDKSTGGEPSAVGATAPNRKRTRKR